VLETSLRPLPSNTLGRLPPSRARVVLPPFYQSIPPLGRFPLSRRRHSRPLGCRSTDGMTAGTLCLHLHPFLDVPIRTLGEMARAMPCQSPVVRLGHNGPPRSLFSTTLSRSSTRTLFSPLVVNTDFTSNDCYGKHLTDDGCSMGLFFFRKARY